jgi:hypothetical protein
MGVCPSASQRRGWFVPVCIASAPPHLPLAQTDPLKRFQYVIAFAVAGLHLTVRQWKPSNPILGIALLRSQPITLIRHFHPGETYQAVYADGTKLYLEQTSHHPPISHFQMFGPGSSFKLFGYARMSASLSGNAIKGTQRGANVVQFADGSRISYSTPEFWLRGILWGERIAEYFGEMEFRDHTNHLCCKLKFNPDATGYLRCSSFRFPASLSSAALG